MAEAKVDRLGGDAVNPPVEHSGYRQGHWWSRLDGFSLAALLVVEFALILVVWQLVVGSWELISPIFLPAPLSIATGFWELASSGELWAHVSISLLAWFIGYSLAVVVGIPVGLALGTSLPVHRLAGPLLWSFYAVPWLAYRPLSLAWFGFGLPPIVFLVFIASTFPVMFNTAAGVGTIDASMLDAGKIFGARGFTVFRKIVMPSALPFVLAGMRQSVVMATISLLVAEMTGPSVGVGAMILYKANTYVTDQAFAGIVLAVVWTVTMSALVRLFARRLAPWQTDVRGA